MRGFIAVVVAAAVVVASGAAAKSAHPDLSGTWSLSRGEVPMDPVLAVKIAPNTVLLHDTGPTELPEGDYGGLKPTASALAAAKAWKPADEMALNKVCSPPSIIYAMQGPFPLQVMQGTEFIIIKQEYYDLIRIVFMDGRGHPPADAPHSKLGHSIGHWDGDTLVVDTTHLEASTILNNGLFHSEDVHVIERFRLSPDGKRLLSSQEFEDPQMLENRGSRSVVWDRAEDPYIYPYDCDPTFSLNYGARTQ